MKQEEPSFFSHLFTGSKFVFSIISVFFFQFALKWKQKNLLFLNVFSAAVVSQICVIGSEKERERKKKKEECMWETFGFCCVRLLLSTCTLVVVVARPFGDLFFLPFFIEGHDIPRPWYTQRSQARHSERMREGVSLLQLKR